MFKIKEHGSTVPREIIAGATTFFAMSYIIFVNPMILGDAGVPKNAVFLATIIATIIGTLVMGLFANVPYAQAPGMGLNAFFTYTVVLGLGFSWQEALAMVFLCGLINIFITVTKIRKSIIQSIPEGLQNAIGGGIGLFIAYIGINNAGLLDLSGGVPSLVSFGSKPVVLALIAIVILIVLSVLKIKGAILITIAATTLIAWPMGLLDTSQTVNFGQAFNELGDTFLVIFTKDGFGSLFSDLSKLPVVLMTIFAFSITDTFDTIGTFLGTGRRTGIFSAEDEKALKHGKGFSSKMDKALFADSVATSIGALFGTSNTTTYVESAAGIAVGGRTGLTSVVTAVLFALSAFLVPVAGIVPAQATAAALIFVGILMVASFKDVKWDQLTEAIPAFCAAVFMSFFYSITEGIAFAFITYVLVKVFTGKFKEIHPILLGSTVLFIANYAMKALPESWLVYELCVVAALIVLIVVFSLRSGAKKKSA